MSTLAQPTTEARSGKMLRAMVGLGILCGLLIVLTYEGTAPIIKENQASALEQAIFEVIPGTEQTRSFRWMEGQGFRVAKAGPGSADELIYGGYDANGQLLGVAIPARGQGYADVIRILYGYNPEAQTVIGFYVLESKETPGLGDKIEQDEDFLNDFAALPVPLNDAGTTVANPLRATNSGKATHPWEVDCISGATISSRAIIEMISESTAQWAPLIQQHRTDFTME